MSSSSEGLIVAEYGESRVRSRRRAQILRRAADLFCQRNHETLTMRDIATALGMERRTLYGYYNNKLDLLVDANLFLAEMVSHDLPFTGEMVSKEMVSDSRGEPAVRARLRATLHAYSQYLFSVLRERRFLMEYESFLRHAPPASETLARFLRIRSRIARQADFIEPLIEEAVSSGEMVLGDHDAHTLSLVVEQSLRAYVLRISDRERFAPHYRSEHVGIFVDTMVNGLFLE